MKKEKEKKPWHNNSKPTSMAAKSNRRLRHQCLWRKETTTHTCCWYINWTWCQSNETDTSSSKKSQLTKTGQTWKRAVFITAQALHVSESSFFYVFFNHFFFVVDNFNILLPSLISLSNHFSNRKSRVNGQTRPGQRGLEELAQEMKRACNCLHGLMLTVRQDPPMSGKRTTISISDGIQQSIHLLRFIGIAIERID